MRRLETGNSKREDSLLIQYIYEFAWLYSMHYHAGDSNKILGIVGEKIELPEAFVKRIGYDEKRILNNFIKSMPPVYRKRNENWMVVQDILLRGTMHMGSTSCVEKCIELGIDPYSYNIERTPEEILVANGYKIMSDFCKEKGKTRAWGSQNLHRFEYIKLSKNRVYVKEKQS